MSGVTVELTDKTLAIFGGALSQIIDKGFDLIPVGISKGGGATVVGGIGLHEACIQLVLANQQAETVPEAGLAVVVAIISVCGSLALIDRSRCASSGSPAELLDRTEPDAVGLAEGAVDCAGFCDAHLGTVDQGRDIGGIGVSVARRSLLRWVY